MSLIVFASDEKNTSRSFRLLQWNK